MAEQIDLSRLTLPLYSFADSDYLAGVSRGTSRRWLTGYTYVNPAGRRIIQPPITPRPDDPGAVSFIDLVEVVGVGELKKAGFSTRAIREIVRNCQEVYNVDRPLATLEFKVGGREIFIERGLALIEVGKKRGQEAWREALEPFLRNLDYANDLARRWWPLGKDNLVVVDPDYGFGFPVIKGSGVRTEIIRERKKAGAFIDEIAEDFNLEPAEVERALQFELNRAA